MNIEFGLEEKMFELDYKNQVKLIDITNSRTNFNSSLKILQVINPNHVFVLNLSNDVQSGRLFQQYKMSYKK